MSKRKKRGNFKRFTSNSKTSNFEYKTVLDENIARWRTSHCWAHKDPLLQ